MEEKRLLKREEGAALVTVLVAIIILLPPTIVLATLALRWQQQSLAFRDRIAQDLAAEGVLAEARARLSGQGIDLAPRAGRRMAADWPRRPYVARDGRRHAHGGKPDSSFQQVIRRGLGCGRHQGMPMLPHHQCRDQRVERIVGGRRPPQEVTREIG